MVRKWSLISMLWLGLIGGDNVAMAQDSADSLAGFWRQKGASIYIEIIDKDGALEAEMVRNDWEPGLVGKFVFKNVVWIKKNKWKGDGYYPKSSKVGTMSLTLGRTGDLSSVLKPGRGNKHKWIRTDPIEKRY